MCGRVKILFCTILVLISSSSASALDFQSSRTLSLAKTGRGGALLNDTITINPSLLGFQPLTSLSATMNWLDQNQTSYGNSTYPARGAGKRRLYNVSIIDGKNPLLNAGVSYTRRPDLDFIHVSLAKRVTSFFSVGTLVKRFSAYSNSDVAKGVTGYETGTSVSFAFSREMLPIPLQVGLTGDNLLHKKEHEIYTGPRQAGVGLKANVKDLLLLYTDFVENFSHLNGNYPSYAGAAEVSLGNDFYVRGGGFGFREKGWSTGAGWVGPKLGISYGYQRKTVAVRPSFQHAVTMDMYM